MKQLKQMIALLLCAVMLFSVVPVPAAYAAEREEETIEEAVLPDISPATWKESVPDTPQDVEISVPDDALPDAPYDEAVPDTPDNVSPPDTRSVSSAPEAVLTDGETPESNGETPEETRAYEISYNVSGTGTWMTVGSDTERAETDDYYALFDKDGNYVIQMRKEDTFPYTVEVRYRMNKDDVWSVPEKFTFKTSYDDEKIAKGVKGEFAVFQEDLKDEKKYPPTTNPVSNESGSVWKIQNHMLGAQSKWLTEVRYRLSTETGWNYLEYNDPAYDESGNYAIPLTVNQISFPLTVYFQYSIPTSDGFTEYRYFKVQASNGQEIDPVFQNMNSTVNVRGRVFSLKASDNVLTPGVVQYSIDYSGNWVTVGPGAGANYQFDKNGNYAIDLGNRKFSSAILIYFRYLGANGWEYLDGSNNLHNSYHQFENVLDTATISGHTFSIYTDWMHDVRYAYLDETGNLPTDWAYVHTYDENGNYTISVDWQFYEWDTAQKEIFNSPISEKPVKIVFQSINPKGYYEDPNGTPGANGEMVGKWDENTLNAHTKTFNKLSDTAEWDKHTFSLSDSHMGELRYTLYYGSGPYTGSYGTGSYSRVGSKTVLSADKNHVNTHKEFGVSADVFDEDGNYTITLSPYSHQLPLHVEALWMTDTGWKPYTLDVTEVSQLNTPLKFTPAKTTEESPSPDTPQESTPEDAGTTEESIPDYTFTFEADFLDTVRYFRAYGNEYDDYTQIRRYESDGGYTLKLDEDVFIPNSSADGTEVYALENPYYIQTWNPKAGWQTWIGDNWTTADTPAPFTDRDSKVTVKTVAGNTHEFRFRYPYTDEVRYQMPDGDNNHDGVVNIQDKLTWVVLGNDAELKEQKAANEKVSYYGAGYYSNYELWENGNRVLKYEDPYLSFSEESVNFNFQVYTKYGWQDAYVKVKDAETPTVTKGSGAFTKASDILVVSADEQGTDAHEFSVYWPFANSVKYTLTGNYYGGSDNKPPVTGYIGTYQDYAEKDPTYFYAESGSAYPIDLPEGYFFPVTMTFEVTDESGRHFSLDAEGNPFQYEFKTNLSDDKYELKDDRFPDVTYTFSVNSNWVGTANKDGTIRVYLPETKDGKNDAVTISVGDGKDLNGNPISAEWLKNNPTYKVFNTDGSFVIPMRPDETFPLKVEFMQRYFDKDPKLETITFNDLNSSVEFGEHTFKLKSDYKDTVRYVTAYGGNPDISNPVTVVGDAQWVKDHNDSNYAAFDANGNYQIPLGDDGALPVDVWYTLPIDGNGAYSEKSSDYKKFTFNKRSDELNFYTVTVGDVFGGTVQLVDSLNENKNSLLAAPGDTIRLEMRDADNTSDGRLTVVYWTGDEKDADEQGNRKPHEITGELSFTMPTSNVIITAVSSGYTEQFPHGSVSVSTDGKTPVEVPRPATFPDAKPHHSFTVYADWMDEVHFRLPQLPKSNTLPTSVEITAGADVERANREKLEAVKENREARYVTYDSKGEYTIQLEDDAFFPYVMDVWFRTADRDGANDPYHGAPLYTRGQVEFATPDSTQTLNGHVFRVASKRVNPKAAVRINLIVGTHIIPLRLETTSPATGLETKTGKPVLASAESAELQSVQPLPEVQLWADLTDSFNLELDNARVEVYLPGSDGKETLAQSFVWGEWNMENTLETDDNGNIKNNAKQIGWTPDRESVSYYVITPNDTRKLSKYVNSKDQTKYDQYFEIITGSTDPLDLSNIRYIVRTETGFASYNDILKMKVAYADDRRGGVPVRKDQFEYKSMDEIRAIDYHVAGFTTGGQDAYTYTPENGTEMPVGVYRITVNGTWKDGKLWFTLKPNENSANYNVFKDLDVEIYEGFYSTAKEARESGKKIPASVWNQELDTQRVKDRYATYTDVLNGPKGITDGPRFTIVWIRTEKDENGNRVQEVDSNGNPVFDEYERDENGNLIPETDRRGNPLMENGQPVYKRLENPVPRYGQPIAIMPFRIIVDVQTDNSYDPAQPGQGNEEPVTFFAPHTYKDFIPGVENKSVNLERISEIYDSQDELITSYYWTNTAGNLYDDRYYVTIQYKDDQDNRNNKWKEDGIKVYAGQKKYKTLSEAQEAASATDSSRAMDVTEQVFNNRGFGADYSNEFSNGVVFSVFDRSGSFLAARRIVTLRREFLGFGRLEGPGVIGDDGQPGVRNNMMKAPEGSATRAYSGQVEYVLPDTEYRGEYEGKTYYTLPITYLRDYAPSSLTDFGVKIVAGSQPYESYEQAAREGEDITSKVTTETVKQEDGTKLEYDVIKYSAAYRRGVYFSLYSKDNKLLDVRYVYATETSRGDDTYFEITGALNKKEGENGCKEYNAYFMPANMDSYYNSGYQTVLILNKDGTPVTDKEIYPTFDFTEEDGSGHPTRIFQNEKNVSELDDKDLAASEVKSGQNAVDFIGNGSATDKPIHYSAAASNNQNVKNYWVTFLTQQKGPKLFVNTGNHTKSDNFQREIFLDIVLNEQVGNYHDIFIANIGDKPLTNVTVTLSKGNASSLKLDNYWQIHGSASISPFTKTVMENADIPGRDRYAEQYHTDVQLPNVTKIRLYPKNNNDTAQINEDIVISADGGEQVTIHLSGTIGMHKITTDYITGSMAKTPRNYDDYTKQAVKYVAFSRLVQTDWTYSSDGVEFSIEPIDQTANSADMQELERLKDEYKTASTPVNLDGVTINYRVPDGFPVGYERARVREATQQIRPNGELFGVPLETGWFAFKVKAKFTYRGTDADGNAVEKEVNEDSKIYLLQVLDNVTADVEARISEEYDVQIWVPDMHITSGQILSEAENQAVYNQIRVSGESVKHRGETETVELNGYPDIYLKFASTGANGVQDYDWMVALYLNGYLLTEGTDYTKKKGSADITLSAKALKEYCNPSGENTLNAFAREGGNTNSTFTKGVSGNFTVNSDVKTTPPARTVVPNSTKTQKDAMKPNGTINPVRPVTPSTNNSNNNNNTNTNTGTTTRRSGGGGGGGGSTPTYYTVTVENTQNGTATVNRTSASSGTQITITATPNANYLVAGFTAENASVTVDANDSNKATFTMPSSNVTVRVTFEAIPHRVNIELTDEARLHGRLEVSPEIATQGTIITITTYPEDGYELQKPTLYDDNGAYLWNQTVNDVDGKVNADNTITFMMPARNITFSAAFEPIRLAGFTDIKGTDWFFDNAVWAYNREIIQGVTTETWNPNGLVSTVTLIRTLSRMDTEVDVEKFWDAQYEKDWIPTGYTAEQALRWAAFAGILTEENFTGHDPITRGQMAVMFKRYLTSAGINVELKEEDLINFPDMALMTDEEIEAFRILRKADVFRGDKDGKMNPQNTSTRAHLAATLNRLSDFIQSYWQSRFM